MRERSEIAAVFISVRRDAPTMDGFRCAAFVAEMIGVSAFEVANAVGLDRVMANPAMKMSVTHNGVTVKNY